MNTKALAEMARELADNFFRHDGGCTVRDNGVCNCSKAHDVAELTMQVFSALRSVQRETEQQTWERAADMAERCSAGIYDSHPIQNDPRQMRRAIARAMRDNASEIAATPTEAA